MDAPSREWVMTSRRSFRALDWTTVVGLPLGLALVLVAQRLEGGSVFSILQGTAALIVVGGTFCAVLVAFTLGEVRRAAAAVRSILYEPTDAPEATIGEIVRFAQHARRHGLVSLEDELPFSTDTFLRTSLGYAVDGAKPQTLRELMELEIANQEEHDEAPARVWEAAGGYSPTMGILGAVLGLIQVMQHLSEPERIGSGIAVAFVATVYGVGLANFVYLPVATKLRLRARRAARQREMVMEGVLAIQEGLHPRLIEEKLRAFLQRPRHGAATAPARKKAA
jgi:chemotaxis protein MotA